MPIRKKGDIKIKTSPNGYRIERTGYTFYSYDKNSAALVFTFVDSDNAPVNLSKADVRLLLISDNGDEFPVDKDDIDVISAIRGTARYVIPENLLGYEGKITGHIYLDFEDGSHTDEGQFTFNIKRSMISDVLPEAGDKYVQDFEDVKERVEQAGDSATKDIEKAKDDAESQIGDYVGEVESAKDSAVEDIDKALPEVEDKLDEVAGKISELDISDTNLLKDTSDEWEEYTYSDWTTGYMGYTLEELGIKVGETLSYQIEYDNTLDESSSDLRAFVNFYDETGDVLDYVRGNRIAHGEKGFSSGSLKIPEGTVRLVAYKMYKSESGTPKTGASRKHKLQRGKYATDWKPNPSEIVTQDQQEKLVTKNQLERFNETITKQLAQNVHNPNLVDRLEKLISYRGMYARVASDDSLRIGVGMSKENASVVEYRFVHNADNLLLLRGVFSGEEDNNVLPNTTLNGSFNTSTEGQYYTTEVGANITFDFVGTKLYFKRWTESRGGMWKITLSTGETRYASCYSSESKYKEDLIFSNLSDSKHYATAEFIGDDPNNPPSSTPSRGYLYQSTSGHRPFRQADVLPINESTAVESVSTGSVPDFAIQGRKNGTSTSFEWTPLHSSVSGVSVDVAVKLKLDGVIYNSVAGDLPAIEGEFKEITSFELTQFFRAINPNATNDGKLWEHTLTHIINDKSPYLTIQNQMELLQDVEFALGYFGMLPSCQTTMDRLILNNQTEYNPIPTVAQEDEYGADVTSGAFTGEYETGLYHGVAIDISSNQEIYNLGKDLEPSVKSRISFRADDVAKIYFTSFRGGVGYTGERFTAQNRICPVAGVQFPNIKLGI